MDCIWIIRTLPREAIRGYKGSVEISANLHIFVCGVGGNRLLENRIKVSSRDLEVFLHMPVEHKRRCVCHLSDAD